MLLATGLRVGWLRKTLRLEGSARASENREGMVECRVAQNCLEKGNNFQWNDLHFVLYLCSRGRDHVEIGVRHGVIHLVKMHSKFQAYQQALGTGYGPQHRLRTLEIKTDFLTPLCATLG